MPRAQQAFSMRSVAGWAWLAFVGLLTLECAARLDDWLRYGAPLGGNYNFDRMFQMTASGVRGVPNARYLRWSLNADGLNGPALLPSAGVRRVVVYGASESFGIYEDSGREFPRALEHALNGSGGERVEVINAGIPGMRVGSGITLLSELGQRLKPDVVVMYPTPTHYIGVQRPYCGRETIVAPPAPANWPESRAVGKLKDQLKRAAPPALLTAARRLSIGLQMHGREAMSKIDDASLLAFEVDLRCAVKAARVAGMTPLLATHANRFGPPRNDDGEWLTGWRQQYPEMQQSGFVDLELRANEVLRSVAQIEGVALIDAAVRLGGQAALFADHAHFTNEGAARMAELLAPAVRTALSDSARAK